MIFITLALAHALALPLLLLSYNSLCFMTGPKICWVSKFSYTPNNTELYEKNMHAHFVVAVKWYFCISQLFFSIPLHPIEPLKKDLNNEQIILQILGYKWTMQTTKNGWCSVPLERISFFTTSSDLSHGRWTNSNSYSNLFIFHEKDLMQ